MKRLFLAVTLSAALVAGGSAAQADHPTHPPKPHDHGHSKRCGVVKRAFIVSGDHASFAGTKNSDGTYTGSLTLTPRHANHAARRSGVDTKAHTPVTLQLTNAHVKLRGPADLSALQDSDKVQVIGKIPYAKKGGHGDKACPDRGFGDDRYDSDNIVVRKVVVHRPTTS